MSYADPVPDTEAQQILANQRTIIGLLEKQGRGIDNCGELLTWIVDNTKGLFEMFGNPQMMTMMAGMMPAIPPNLTGAIGDGTPKE